jgi:segregation and condensation protein A
MADLYRVKLDVFEGPLDLLLHLIKKNEVEIVNIPVATITEQYMAYLEMLRDLNLDVAGEFLVMAATLMLIKSRMLLPPSEDEHDQEEADPRADLVRQLLEYQRYREAALALSERPLLRRDVFVREPQLDVEAGDPTEAAPRLKVTVWELLEAFRTVLQRAHPDAVHEVITDPVSLRDRARELLQRLSVARCLDFESLFDTDATRLEIVVTFLALLELVKMGAVRAAQEALWGRIVIELTVDDPTGVSFGALDEYDSQSLTAHGPGGEPGAGVGTDPSELPPRGS